MEQIQSKVLLWREGRPLEDSRNKLDILQQAVMNKVNEVLAKNNTMALLENPRRAFFHSVIVLCLAPITYTILKIVED